MTLRELKYVILGDDKLSDKMNRISGASDKATRSLGSHSSKLDGLKSKYTQMASSIPIFGNALGNAEGMLSGVALGASAAGAAIGVLGLALRKGVTEASNFELEFRKLQNINLDKTIAQVGALRDKVLEISGKGGFDPNVISQGYFDIQSLTGITGGITENIVKSQAEFARASGANQNKYISGTGIAMKNFGFGPDQLQAYNKSAMGLVATAKITYDQLAEVSAMYAGPAAAANQSFNSANKLMAIFTTKTKSAEEAATLTKQAFTDLFKKTTIDSFKSIGISMYDVHGNAKQVDQIMLELNKKFASRTSAQAMDELRNKFAGSEGINAMLSASKDQSGALFNTLSQFDKGGDGLAKMLKSAKTDINIINDQLNNKLKTSWVKLGEAVLPTWIKLKQDIVDTLSIWAGITTKRDILKENVKDKVMNEFNLDGMTQDQKNLYVPMLRNKLSEAHRKGQKSGNIDDIATQTGLMMGYSQILNDIRSGNVSATQLLTGGDILTPTGGDQTLKNGMASISGGGVRNVTVTFKNLVENFTVQTTNLTDGSGKIKTDIEAMLVKAIAGSEQILGAN